MIGFGILLYLIHFLERDPSDPYSRPIVSDAKGYYAYLPAIFIYQDLDYEFIPEMDNKYYAVGHDKHIFIEVDGERVNKTFPGVALLYLPFFLLAHFLALLFGLEADGYSLVYQYLFDFGQFFYATLGLVIVGKFLERLKFKKWSVLLSIIIVSIGSNLWFYIIYDQSVTHVYNFFLISLLLYFLQLFSDRKSAKYLILAGIAFSLILIVRPTGLLSLFLVAFFFPEARLYKNIWQQIKNIKVLSLSVIFSFLVLLIPLILWKVQSGNWIVYSYGEEGFDFSNPHIIDFLFSYAKGWWLYSPLILLSIFFGGIILIKEGERRRLTILVLFLITSVYVFSSWWCWYYGFSFGQRVMVDFSLLYMYLWTTIITKLNRKRLLGFSPILVFLMFLNIHQSHQHHNGYYQTPTPTKEMYWDNFLIFQKQAKVYLGKDEKVLKIIPFDFEENLNEYSGYIVEHSEARNGKRMTLLDAEHQFSGNINFSNELFLDKRLIISAYVNAQMGIQYTSLVVEHPDYPETYRSYHLKEFTRIGEWVLVSFMYENEFEQSSNDIHIYFWNEDSGERLYIDDLMIQILD